RTGYTQELPATGAAIDPRLDPTGRHVAYAADRALRVISLVGSQDGSATDRHLIGPDPAELEAGTVCWGQAEFIASEELDRFRGFWWSPDGSALLVERYDNAPVDVWH